MPKGLFCANFGSKQESWNICNQVWCSKCYIALGNLALHVKEAKNKVGAVWKRKKDMGRFMFAREGDMWVAPFQFDRCWFVNLEKREPVVGLRVDERLLNGIRRVNLDVMWSREPGTILGSYR
jgi:hypothetical protein